MGQGLIAWLAAAAFTVTVARLIRSGRPPLWVEITVGLLSAMLAGATATALDFGGWAEPDPRAIAFAFLITAAALGLTRTATLLARR
jgi:hypothetical protein